MQALHDVVKAGYVRYIGMSSCYAYQCQRDFFLFFQRCKIDKYNTLVHAMQSEHDFWWLTCSSTWKSFLDYAITKGLTPFISMQNHYSLVYREEEREMMPTLKVRNSLNVRYFHRMESSSSSVWDQFPGLRWQRGSSPDHCRRRLNGAKVISRSPIVFFFLHRLNVFQICGIWKSGRK